MTAYHLIMNRVTKALLLAFAFIAISVLPSYAQSAVPTEVPTRARERMEENTQNREERRVQLTADRQARIREFFGKINTKLQAAIDRLKNLAERIGSRLAKYKEQNPEVDITEIESELADANALIAETETSFEELKAKLPDWIDQMFESETPRDVFEEIKTAYKEIRSNLTEAHTMLAHIIGDIKGLRVGETEK